VAIHISGEIRNVYPPFKLLTPSNKVVIWIPIDLKSKKSAEELNRRLRVLKSKGLK